jgi:glycosyltransferase involved in cell wall biosynthesis
MLNIVNNINTRRSEYSEAGLGLNAGELITAFILYKAAIVLNDNFLKEETFQVLLNCAEKRDPVHNYVWDAGLFRGSAGVTLIFKQLFDGTHNTVFANAQDYWLKETLLKAVANYDNAGYYAFDANNIDNQRSLLAGITGIGLTLLSMKSERKTYHIAASNKSNHPVVSIVMPAYNNEMFIKEAIDSILNQTFTNFELIVIDDGSEDNTVNIVKTYTDARLSLIEMPHNYIASLNKGLDIARGKYLARMDADDIMKPNRLELQTEYMEKNCNIDICGAYANYSEWSDALVTVPTNHINIACAMFKANVIINPTAFCRLDSLRNNNIRYKSDYIYAEDYKFWTDCIMNSLKINNLPLSLLNYRCHENQITRVHNHELCTVSEKIKIEYFNYALAMLCSVSEEVADFIKSLPSLIASGQFAMEREKKTIIKMYRNMLLHNVI